MNQLASVMKNDELSRLSISKLKIDFKLENGNIIVEPFKTSFAGNPVTIYGNQTVDGQLDYTLSMNIDRKFSARTSTTSEIYSGFRTILKIWISMQRSRNAVEAGYQTRPFQSDQSGHQSSRERIER